MTSKGRDNARFKHGLRAGWTEYRYGTAKPVSVAPIFRGGQRDHAINRVLDVLSDWRQSPFEYEGAARSGLRAALCLRGSRWVASDREAESVVSAALSLMGAERPSWEQGQRHYSEPRENCRWCYVPLDDSDQRAGFCSPEHARFAHQHWGFETRSSADTAFGAVDRAIRSLSLPKRNCARCGARFRPQREQSHQEFCSLNCALTSRRLATPSRSCAECGSAFVPASSNLDARYCSRRCVNLARSSITIDATCDICSQAFVTRSRKARFCSTACAQIESKFKHGRPPKRISAPVFDYLFKMAA